MWKSDLPSEIIAGTTVEWVDEATTAGINKTISSPNWTLEYFLRTNTASEGHIATGTQYSNSTGWQFTISATDSAGFIAGNWFWVARAFNSGDVFEIGSYGYVHFHASTTEEYFKQITAERQILKTNRSGFQMPQWVKKAGVRNECLDTWVYSYAAMCLYISKFNRNTVWEQLENKINKPDDVVKQKKGTIRTSRKNDFVTNW